MRLSHKGDAAGLGLQQRDSSGFSWDGSGAVLHSRNLAATSDSEGRVVIGRGGPEQCDAALGKALLLPVTIDHLAEQREGEAVQEGVFRLKASNQHMGDEGRPDQRPDGRDFGADSSDSRVCELCGGIEQRPDSHRTDICLLGRLLPLSATGTFVHANCVRWMSSMVERNGLLTGVNEAILRYRK